MRWAIVEISSGVSVLECAVVPENWLDREHTGCFWPMTKNAAALVARACEPDGKFLFYSCRVIKWFETYGEARKKLPVATQKSDLESEPLDQPTRRRVRHRKLFTSDSDLSDDDDGSSAAKISRTNLPAVRKIGVKSLLSSKAQIQCPGQFAVMTSTQSPLKEPMRSPVMKPLAVPVKSPCKTPVNSPFKSPAKFSFKTPVKSPFKTPVKSPFKTPVKSPFKTPVNSPRTSRLISNSSDKTPSTTPRDVSALTPSSNTPSISFSIESPPEGGNELENSNVSGLQLLKVFLTKIEKITEMIRRQGDQLNEVTHRLRCKEKWPSRPRHFPTLPIKTLDEFDVLEDCLQNKDNETYMIKRLQSIRGTSVKSTITLMMADVLTRNVGAFFNWAGKGKKKAFKHTRVCRALLEAAKVSTKAASHTDITQPIKEWLKYCPFRG